MPQLQIRRDLLAKPSTITSTTTKPLEPTFLGTFRKRAFDQDRPSCSPGLMGRTPLGSPRPRTPSSYGHSRPLSPPMTLRMGMSHSPYHQTLTMNSMQPGGMLKPPDGSSGGMMCMPGTSKQAGQVSPNSTPSDLSMKKVDHGGGAPPAPARLPPKKTGFTIADIMGR